jgi:dipeptidyl aminopeptidase/acylaminoacyl peptidase
VWNAGRETEVRRLRIAGRFVAWSYVARSRGGAEHIRVVDRTTGRTVLRLDDLFEDFALREDGTVVALRETGAAPDVVVAAPSAPRLRVIAREAVESGVGVEVAGTRVAFAQYRPDGKRIVVVPVTGGRARIAARFKRRGPSPGQLALDGRRLAWAEHDPLVGDAQEPTSGRVHLIDVP